MILTPVGVGAAIAVGGGAQSSYLVQSGETSILMDMGAGALSHLSAHVAPESLDAILITHLHPDHCVDLLAMRVHLAFGPGRGHRIDVFGPPGLRERMIAFAGAEGWDESFAHHDLEPGEVRVGALTARAALVPHLDPTFALRVTDGNHSVTYSADCAENDALVELARGTDVLVCECTLGADAVPSGLPHLNAAAAARIANAADARHLSLTHLEPGRSADDALAEASRDATCPVDWAVAAESVRVGEG
ncbi:MAG: MBL fold metallo-hydrolase [Actinobacteria bacterium]|nr:MBL fold metallo-hydrolase [Actinomycetota bacterium]